MAENEARPGQPRLLYDIAWTYDRLGMPDSALGYARAAWELRPQDQWFLAELMRSLWKLDMAPGVTALSGFVRGGGAARYYSALSGDQASIEWLEGALLSGCDSTAADAACWLSMIAASSGDEALALELARRSVLLRPGDGFYRSLLVERLSRAGRVEEAAGHLLELRLSAGSSLYYWSAAAALGEASGDTERRVWALRRSLEARWTRESADDLGWALVSAGLESLRGGFTLVARDRLEEASALAAAGTELQCCADSLLGVLDEFEEAASSL